MESDFDKDLFAYFTDVDYLRDLFKALVSAPALPKRLLVIHGVGGVGKSSLLRMFRLHCKGAHVPVALASGDEQKSAFDVLARWTDDLKADGVAFPSFGKTFEHYRAIQAKVDEQAKKAQDTRSRMADIASKAASKTAEAAGGALAGAAIGSVIPGIGTAVGATLGGVLGGTGAEALVDWLRGFLKQPDIDLLLDPVKKLTDDFLADVAQAADKRRIVLMLDTFEQMTALDYWVREVAQRLHANVLFVIAGRVLLSWSHAWDGWLAHAQIEELKPMSKGNMRELVQRYYATMRGGEPNPAQVEAIIRFARGLPMVVTSAVYWWVNYSTEDFQAVKPRVVADLVDCLMKGVPKALIPALEAAAVVRWFDQPILRAVTGLADVREVYDELQRFPFVRSRAEGFALHNAVREIMDENLCVQDSERHRELHERAAAYFEKRLEKAENENWEHLLLERVYHRIKADWQSGINLCVFAIEEATRLYALSLVELLIKELYDAETSGGSFPHIFYAEGLLRLARNSFQDAVSLLQKALASQSVPIELKFKTTERLAYTLTLQGNLEEALRFYEDCVRLASEAQKPLWQINSWNGIETVLRRLGYLSRTIEVLRKSIETCKSIGMENSFEMAWAQDSLGIALGIVGQWKQAVYHHQQALNIYETLGNDYNAAIVLHNMTQVNRKQDYDPGQVITKFQKAMSIFEKFGDERWIRYCKLNIAETLIGTAQLEEAERILESIENSDATAEIWSSRLSGNIQQYREECDKATASYTKALRLSEYQGRSRDKVEILTRLSSVHLLRGDLDAIPPLLAEVEQLARQYEYNDHLASLRLTQGHIAWDGHIPEWGSGFDAALRYYQRALGYALRYNRFLLDEVLSGRPQGTPLRPIIPHCLARGEEGRRMLIALRDWWKTGINDIGTPRPDTISPIPGGIALLEAERIAREREPGDGSPQKSAVEQIEAAL